MPTQELVDEWQHYSFIAKRQKQPRCPISDKKIWYMHMMMYYSTINRNEAVTHENPEQRNQSGFVVA